MYGSTLFFNWEAFWLFPLWGYYINKQSCICFTIVGWTSMFIYIARSGSDVKESASNTDLSSVPEFGRFPWRRAWQPTPVFLPGESPWQKSLACYNPWSHKELIMTEQTGVEMQGWIVILCLSFWGPEEFLKWLLHFTVSAAM